MSLNDRVERWLGHRPPQGLEPRPAVATVVDERHPEGYIRLGIEARPGGRPFDLAVPGDIGQHVTLLGVTGSGKTTTAERLMAGALAAGCGVGIVDAKGGGLRQTAQRLAASAGAELVELVPGDPGSLAYNPCRVGSRSQVADKLLSAFSFGPEAQIYKNISAETLSVLVGVLRAMGEEVTIRRLKDAIGPDLVGLGDRARHADPVLADELVKIARRPAPYPAALAGLSARLGALLQGEFGEIFDGKGEELDLAAALRPGRVTYISLPAMASEGDVALMARVLILDIKQAAYERLRTGDAPPCLLFLDEFAALDEPQQICDLLRQAREARIATVVATQHLPEAVPLRQSLLGAGLVIAHRLGHDDAGAVADLIGTKTATERTTAVDPQGMPTGHSTSRHEQYLVHPNTIKQLRTGEAAVLASAGERRIAVLRVIPAGR